MLVFYRQADEFGPSIKKATFLNTSKDRMDHHDSLFEFMKNLALFHLVECILF